MALTWQAVLTFYRHLRLFAPDTQPRGPGAAAPKICVFASPRTKMWVVWFS